MELPSYFLDRSLLALLLFTWWTVEEITLNIQFSQLTHPHREGLEETYLQAVYPLLEAIFVPTGWLRADLNKGIHRRPEIQACA